MAKSPTPRPIFDTLTNLSDALNKNIDTAMPLAFEFLKQYDGNDSTYRCYRQEIERLIQWSWLWLPQEKSILELTRDDNENIIDYNPVSSKLLKYKI